MKSRVPFAFILIAAGALLAAAMMVETSSQSLVAVKGLSMDTATVRRQGVRTSVQRNEVFDRIIRLVEQDPEVAISEAMSLGASPDRDEVLMGVAAELVRANPHQALELGVSLPDSLERDELLLRAIRELALSDHEDAIHWAKTFESADLSVVDRLLAAALVEWSEANPHAAASMAALELSEGRIQDDAVVSIAQRWHQRDPEAAEAWVSSFSEGELRSSAIAAIGSNRSP